MSVVIRDAEEDVILAQVRSYKKHGRLKRLSLLPSNEGSNWPMILVLEMWKWSKIFLR